MVDNTQYRHTCGAGLGVLLLICVIALPGGEAGGADYAVHVVVPAITDHMIVPDGPLPPICKDIKTIELRACRGEYESGSFVVTASEPLEEVRIEVGQVTGPGQAWPTDAVDVRVVKDFSRRVSWGYRVIPTLLVHDDNFLGIEPAPTKSRWKPTQNVVRGKLQDADELQPVRIDGRRQFWITVRVPDNAKPGTHSAPIRITPKNGAATSLLLRVQVYPIDLLEPMLEYSIYYPVELDENLPAYSTAKFRTLNEKQYLVELQNMVAHGLTNPNIYWSLSTRADGTLDFSKLSKILALREQAGMRRGALYLVPGHPIPFRDRPLTPDERLTTQKYVPQINAWARQRGYGEVFFMAMDELRGERLSGERDSMATVQQAGGRVFVATGHDFMDRVGDVLDLPVLGADVEGHVNRATRKYGRREALRHMSEIGRAGSFERMQFSEKYREVIDGVHRLGYRIFTYMDPVAGLPLPDLQRRNEGLGLWRVGFDGTMTWAYVHNSGSALEQAGQHAMVFRTEGGVLDTLHWEGFREGVDDVRYMTTLLDTLNRARGRFPGDPLIAQTSEWIDSIDVVGGDLDAIRHEMVQRIIALLDMGYEELTPEELLASIDFKGLEIITMPEPWRFKMDVDNKGVREKWFDPAVDDSQWGKLRTDTKDKGWGTDPGFGWYRNELPLTGQGLKKKFKYLYFEAVDEDARMCLNGERFFAHTVRSTGLAPEEIRRTPFSVSLEGMELRGKDLLAVRVRNRDGIGGILRPVRLVLSDERLTRRQLNVLCKLKPEHDVK